MQTQINRAINYAINDKLVPKIQSKVGRLPLRENNLVGGQGLCDRPDGSQTNIKPICLR